MSHLESFQAIWSHLEPFGAIWTHLEPFGAILTHFDSFGVVWSGLDQKNPKFDQKLFLFFFCPYELYMDFMNNGHQVPGLDLRPEVRLG